MNWSTVSSFYCVMLLKTCLNIRFFAFGYAFGVRAVFSYSVALSSKIISWPGSINILYNS